MRDTEGELMTEAEGEAEPGVVQPQPSHGAASSGGSKEQVVPWRLRRSQSSADTLILVPSHPFSTSDLPKCKKLDLCYFKPLGLWSFIAAATGKY